MFRRQKGGSHANTAQEQRQRNESSGDEIQAGIVELRGLPREKLADAVFMLWMAAKQQSGLIRRSIKESASAEFDCHSPSGGDMASYLAEDAVSTLRHHAADLPKLLDVLLERSPGVHFTVRERDAVSMLAAMIREQRLEGILEGLRLAGLLNESPKDRHGGFGKT
ncbi:hypothetical protein AYJ54_31660 [Bradyrhizobium centrolobii]|uniref:Uncharacterized protein n=1 Tax=Bradyrhizobium centrolobii TaxID=1505087 RepID=A0A176Y9U6_9BRAD|nr:hypothetical protein [Bradyrhizobium centrolobii]OAF00420.1 hypothetical protein AYJ54_31660 [Bradyrhizobium centrolobii]